MMAGIAALGVVLTVWACSNDNTDGAGGGGGTTTTTTTTGGAGPGGSGGAATGGSGGSGCGTGVLGAACADVCDCASGVCFVVGPLGGVCSSCDEDADCAATTGFGCNFGNPLSGTPAVCSTTGTAGESCESVSACAASLYCVTVVEVPGILSTATCSACEPVGNAGCVGSDICAPAYDIANFGGSYACVVPGAVANGGGCNLTGDGSECASGQCAPAALQGIPVVGVCAPCNEDGDCGLGTCILPEVALEGTTLTLIPGSCS